jgi:hypothetical protein
VGPGRERFKYVRVVLGAVTTDGLAKARRATTRRNLAVVTYIVVQRPDTADVDPI